MNSGVVPRFVQNLENAQNWPKAGGGGCSDLAKHKRGTPIWQAQNLKLSTTQ